MRAWCGVVSACHWSRRDAVQADMTVQGTREGAVRSPSQRRQGMRQGLRMVVAVNMFGCVFSSDSPPLCRPAAPCHV